jgi:mannose-6-phosphate isomerase-like protein (cupin superfamily)
MRLKKVNLGDVGAQLDEPFSMMDMAIVGDLTVSLYLCQGVLAWHRHLDQDELFWVHQGVIRLESEHGQVQLRPGELTVVPKGLAHRSSSPLRSTVVLIRCTIVPERKNGKRRLYATRKRGLRRVRLNAAAARLSDPFQPQTVARLEDAGVQVIRIEGASPLAELASHDILLVTVSGEVIVRTEDDTQTLQVDDLTVLPQGTLYRVSASGEAMLVQVTRGD